MESWKSVLQGKPSMGAQFEQKDDLFKSLVTSLLVSVPGFCAALYFMEAKFVWDEPGLVVAFILGFAFANFAAIVILEHYRSNIGKLTLPAMLSAVGLVMLFVITEGLNRTFHFGYEWLFPAVILAMGLILIAIFKERRVLLKCHLAVNEVVVGILWGLGVMDRVALPF